MGLDKLVDMSRVIGKALLMQLASIETIHKELQAAFNASGQREKQRERRAKRAR